MHTEVNDLKNRYSEKARLEILAELSKSDLSVIKFAREKSIPSSTIITWLKREKETKQVDDKTFNHKDEWKELSEICFVISR